MAILYPLSICSTVLLELSKEARSSLQFSPTYGQKCSFAHQSHHSLDTSQISFVLLLPSPPREVQEEKRAVRPQLLAQKGSAQFKEEEESSSNETAQFGDGVEALAMHRGCMCVHVHSLLKGAADIAGGACRWSQLTTHPLATDTAGGVCRWLPTAPQLPEGAPHLPLPHSHHRHHHHLWELSLPPQPLGARAVHWLRPVSHYSPPSRREREQPVLGTIQLRERAGGFTPVLLSALFPSVEKTQVVLMCFPDSDHPSLGKAGRAEEEGETAD